MFIRQDLGLAAAVNDLQRWMLAPELEEPENARLAVAQIFQAANLLDIWSERDVAQDLRNAAARAEQALDQAKGERNARVYPEVERDIQEILQLPTFDRHAAMSAALTFWRRRDAEFRSKRFVAQHNELLQKLSDAVEAVARLCPLEGNVNPAGARRGMVVGLALERALAFQREEECALWQCVRGQFSSLGATRFTPYQSTGPKNERSDLWFVDAHGQQRTVVYPSGGPILHDERGQPIATGTPQRRQTVAYFWVGGERAAHQLTGVASALGTLTRAGASGPNFTFRMLAASAMIEVPGTVKDRMRIKETGQLFDLFSQIIRDPLLANTIVTHEELRCMQKERRHAHWFESVWRVPVQHRRRHADCDEWLYASPRFNGLPEFASAVSPAPRRRAVGLERPTVDAERRRLSSRLETGRPLPCHIGFRQLPGKKQPAYLVDYSPDGCKVLLSKDELILGADGLVVQVDGVAVDRVWWPEGLPWPWEHLRCPEEMFVEEAKRRDKPPLRGLDELAPSGMFEISLRLRLALRDQLG